MRLYPRINTNFSADVELDSVRRKAVITNISSEGAYVREPHNKGITGKNILIRYELPGHASLEYGGRIVREDRSGYALNFSNKDHVSKLKLWEYISENLNGLRACPYCGQSYTVVLPSACQRCGQGLNFNSPGYFEYCEKMSLFKKLNSEAERLTADQMRRLINFVEVDILKTENKELFQEFVGASDTMSAVFSRIRKVAPTDIPVLILGESGTGKELTALAVHERSQRKDGPFVAVNCAAIPEGLLEAELFGYERGSFTGAYNSRKGKFECADKGTVFLDEIGEIPHGLQAKLLRILETRVVERIGSTGGKKVDVRFIAATNRNVTEAIRSGGFREDLYYRLNGLTITLPPLKERGEDKAILAKYYLKRISRDSLGRVTDFTAEALRAINLYDWPGNVRELINRIRRAVVMASGEYITSEDLELGGYGAAQEPSFKSELSRMQKELVMRALAENDFVISRAASALDISRPSLYLLMKKYSIDLPKKAKGLA